MLFMNAFAVQPFCNLACFLSDVSFSARFPKLGFMSCQKANEII